MTLIDIAKHDVGSVPTSEELLKAGEYQLQIESAEHKTSDKGVEYLNIRGSIPEHPNSGVIFFPIFFPRDGAQEHQNQGTKIKLHAFCECFSFSLEQLDTDEMPGHLGWVTIGIKKNNRTQADENTVTGFTTGKQ